MIAKLHASVRAVAAAVAPSLSSAKTAPIGGMSVQYIQMIAVAGYALSGVAINVAATGVDVNYYQFLGVYIKASGSSVKRLNYTE